MSFTVESLSTAEQAAIAYLRSPQAIRDRCSQLFSLALDDQLQYFRCDLSQLDRTADYVIRVIRETYPDLQVPFHSRWRHFEAGGTARLSQFHQQISTFDPIEQARIQFDLVIISVLLDAGAGDRWQYTEPGTGAVYSRSEGLAVASWHLFQQGLFSSNPDFPLQVDAIGLQQLTETKLAEGFQVSSDNPLIGIAGRVTLLQRLGQILAELPQFFGDRPPRPGHLVDYLQSQANQNQLAARQVLQAVLNSFSEIWAGRIKLAGVNLGDVWHHSALPDTGIGTQFVPFHKLSQWLSYSLLEPLQDLGLTIIDLNELTGLPEYRNGGLCLDLGLLQLKQPTLIEQQHEPGSELIVEWRSLTVILLDRLADTIRQQLNLSETNLPLVKVLQGGTWAAGRRIAAERRDGAPPLNITSDGTVF